MQNSLPLFIILVAFSACTSAPQTNTEQIVKEELETRLVSKTENGKTVYTVENNRVSTNTSLETAIRKKTFLMEKTCPSGFEIINIRKSEIYSNIIPGTSITNYNHNVYADYICT